MLEEIDATLKHEHEQEIFRALTTQNERDNVKLFVQQGIVGYEESMVLSPAGAEWILESLELHQGDYFFFDYFICMKLCKLMQELLDSEKGLYCPRFKGFSFVKEYLRMGTATNWAHRQSAHYEESIVIDVPLFLELEELYD